jgi:formate-dependent nitrite reductase membrane component NrfD
VSQAMQDGLMGADARDLARKLPSHFIGTAGALPGFFVGGYTGVLLGATAVPIWAKSANLLGPLFLSSAVSSAASAITLALIASGAEDSTLQRLEEIERVAIAAEVGLLLTAARQLGTTAQPFKEGKLRRIVLGGVIGIGIVAPFSLQFGNRKLQSRKVSVAGSIFALAGGFALRYAVVTAGHASADDPQETFELAR